MKTTLATAIVTISLTTLIWLFFYLEVRDAPLTAQETTGVAVACLVVCVIVQAIWHAIHKEKKK